MSYGTLIIPTYYTTYKTSNYDYGSYYDLCTFNLCDPNSVRPLQLPSGFMRNDNYYNNSIIGTQRCICIGIIIGF